MDKVRFGRALGFGAKQAMKTLAAAVDAATAESPSAKNAASSTTRSPGPSANTGSSAAQSRGSAAATASSAQSARPAAVTAAADSAARTAAVKATQTVIRAREVQRGLGRGTKRFGEAVWRPFVRLSGVVWLEVSGVFFGVFALLALGYLWKFRGAWRESTADAGARRSLLGAVVILALFGYFCVSSFVRARRRERGR
jgi:hypothetical protein